MSCCDEYGNCRQGRDCPIRKTPLNTKHGGERVDTDAETSESTVGRTLPIAVPIYLLLVALAALAGWLI